MKADIIEIMSSIQGEGLTVGLRQIFIRFAKCNLRCNYCDTPKSLVADGYCIVEQTPGARDFKNYPNPVALQDLITIIKGYDLSKIHSVSLTGGEPLIHVDFLRSLLPELKELGLKTYLETNGTLTQALKEIVLDLDYISMDMKLESVTGAKIPLNTHREFLEIANQGPEKVFVKIVIGNNTTLEEISVVSRTISQVNKNIPLILQPVSSSEEFKALAGPGVKQTLEFQDEALSHLSEVRVIPQTHKILGQL